MPTPLTKLAIIDTSASPDDVVLLSAIQEGGEGATRQVFEVTDNDASIEDNQIYAPSGNFTLTMAGLPTTSTKRDLLDAWIDGRELEFAGFGTDLIFQGRGSLGFAPGYGGEHKTWRIRSTKTAEHGYGADGQLASQMSYHESGLAEYLWGDLTESGIADGWTKVGTEVSALFSSGEQFLSVNEGTLAIEREIYFPFPGRTLTLSISAISYELAGNLTRRLQIQTIDEDGATIDTHNDEFTGTGRKSTSYALDAGTHTVKARIEIEEAGAGSPGSITFSNPMLTINGLTKYIR